MLSISSAVYNNYLCSNLYDSMVFRELKLGLLSKDLAFKFLQKYGVIISLVSNFAQYLEILHIKISLKVLTEQP